MKGYKIPLGFVEGYRNAIERYPKDSEYAWGMNAVVEALEVHPLEELDENPWHTGTPTEEGWYLQRIKSKNNISYDTDYYENGDWKYSCVFREIIAWQKIEEEKSDI